MTDKNVKQINNGTLRNISTMPYHRVEGNSLCQAIDYKARSRNRKQLKLDGKTQSKAP